MYLAILKQIGHGSKSLTPPPCFNIHKLMEVYHFVFVEY